MVSVLDDIFEVKQKPNTVTTVAVQAIQTAGGTQMRAALSNDTVSEYRDALLEGAVLPPIVVFYDGQDYWLADGFHRVAAHRQAYGTPGSAYKDLSKPEIAADVRAGTRRDAVLYAAQANASHGLRRTNADKQRAVRALLEDPEWSQWSDGEIARKCAVSQPFVSGLRRDFAPERHSVIVRLPDSPTEDEEDELTHNRYESTPVVRKGADGRTINTANIGKTPKEKLVYAQNYELQGMIFRQYSADELRDAAKQRGDHWLWVAIKNHINGRGFRYRENDLSEAINDVAGDIERIKEMERANAVIRQRDKEREVIAQQAIALSVPLAPATPDKPMVEWTEAEWEEAEAKAKGIDPEQAAKNAARCDQAIDLLGTYWQVLRTEKQYSELTGDFMGTVPVSEGLRKMVKGLESLIEALQ